MCNEFTTFLENFLKRIYFSPDTSSSITSHVVRNPIKSKTVVADSMGRGYPQKERTKVRGSGVVKMGKGCIHWIDAAGGNFFHNNKLGRIILRKIIASRFTYFLVTD